jgi:hypothetical protein
MRAVLEALYKAAPETAAPVRRPPVVADPFAGLGFGGGGAPDPFAYNADPVSSYDPYAFDPEMLGGYAQDGNVGLPPTLSEEAFDDPVMALIKRGATNPELAEALVTEQTDRGTRIGSWEIVESKDGRGLKSYAVANVTTGDLIATELSLYEAAYGIVRQLNAGNMINSHKVREILNVEAEYARARMNAAEFRDRSRVYEQRGDETRSALMEDRFDAALGLAKSARQRLTRIVK